MLIRHCSTKLILICFDMFFHTTSKCIQVESFLLQFYLSQAIYFSNLYWTTSAIPGSSLHQGKALPSRPIPIFRLKSIAVVDNFWQFFYFCYYCIYFKKSIKIYLINNLKKFLRLLFPTAGHVTTPLKPIILVAGV